MATLPLARTGSIHTESELINFNCPEDSKTQTLGKIIIMASRHIPADIDKEVKVRHFFECAWCGEKLTERDHIIEFSQGGEHTSEN